MHNGQLTIENSQCRITMHNAELTIENDQFRLYAADVSDRIIDGAAVRKARLSEQSECVLFEQRRRCRYQPDASLAMSFFAQAKKGKAKQPERKKTFQKPHRHWKVKKKSIEDIFRLGKNPPIS